VKVQGSIEFTITEQSPDRVVGTMPINAGVLNPYGVVNAGAMLWFADVCAKVLTLGNADVRAGGSGFPLAIALSAAFIGNQKDGSFTATSSFVKKGRTLSVVRTTITGDLGRMIADVTTSHIPAN
jgi:acyl-coenzyme A thioesterase PaaI-like protein